MSDQPRSASRVLPENPDLRHLKNQAKDRLRAKHAASLTDAQFQLAREYGFSSWSTLKAHVETLQEVGQLKAAIDANDVERVCRMMTQNPKLDQAPLGYNENGPLTWAAESRGAAPNSDRLAIARWMVENGSDVHQGGDGPLMRAALSDKSLSMMELLVAHGADVNAWWDGHYPIIFAACETLQPQALRWLIDQGADFNVVDRDGGNCVRMLVGTYWRNPTGKHACLEVFAEAGYPFPDTAPMAIHRGRLDLLEACLKRDPLAIHRQMTIPELFPIAEDALHCAPLNGATLLHLAIEYHEMETTQWLIDHGADVNARCTIDSDGFGGHTPLFHTTVTLLLKSDTMARLLLRNGADPQLRATFRKRLSMNGDSDRERMHEYYNVTAIEFARQFQEPRWVNEEAIKAISEFGGE